MFLLFACPAMKELASRMQRNNPSKVELGELSWEKFPDGFPNLKIETKIYARDVIFLASFDSPAAIFDQLAVVDAIPRLGARSLNLVLPYFPTGTMERVQHTGEIATAMTLARMLSAIPHCRGTGMAEIMIFDIHALQEQFYFSDQVLPRLVSGIPLLEEKLQGLEQGGQKFVIVFPDDGAKKRFGDMFPDREQIVCQKIRQGDSRKVTIKEGDPQGQHLVIVDDLVMSGGTLLECCKVLTDQGACSVSAYVTHGVFPNHSWRRFLDAGFYKFWLTDSCPLSSQTLYGKKPFEVLSLEELILNNIANIAQEP